jgi:hypothetical protein
MKTRVLRLCGNCLNEEVLALLYFIYHQEEFPTMADKVTYFSGVCLGPAAAIQIILQFYFVTFMPHFILNGTYRAYGAYVSYIRLHRDPSVPCVP